VASTRFKSPATHATQSGADVFKIRTVNGLERFIAVPEQYTQRGCINWYRVITMAVFSSRRLQCASGT
jgi:hypothetical protein